MKKAFRIFLLVIAVILVLNIIVVALLSNKSVQKSLVSYGENWLRERTNTELSLGYIGFDLLNGFFVENIYVEDQRGDTLLFAGRIKADINLHALLNINNLKIKKVELDDFTAHVYKETDSSAFNFQFLIDAFASDEPKVDKPKDKPFAMSIHSVVLKNGRASYEVRSAEETPGLFNASHIVCDGLNMEASFALSSEGAISVGVESLSLSEKSGLRVENLELEATLEDNKLSLPSLALSLPKSQLALKGEGALDDLTYDVTLSSDSFSLADLRCFVPMFACMTDSTALSLHAYGKFPAVNVEDLKINYPSLLQLSAPVVKMEDCLAWDSTAYVLRIDEFSLTKQGMDRIMTMVGKESNPTLSEYLPMRLALQFDGPLSNAKLKGDLASTLASLSLEGTLRYVNRENYLGCDLSTSFTDVALDSILHSDDFKRLSMTADLQLDWKMEALPDARLVARLPDFSYKGYAYDTLRLNAHYFTTDSLSSFVEVRDPNLFCNAKVEAANLSGEVPRVALATVIRHFSPQATHLADSLGNARIDVALSARVTDLNALMGEVAIDSLNLCGDSAHIIWSKPSVARHVVQSDGTRHLYFASPALDVDLKGHYDFADIYPSVMGVVRSYWPHLFLKMDVPEGGKENHFAFNLKVKEVEDLMRFIGQDISVKGGASLSGRLSAPDNSLELKLDMPSFRSGTSVLRDIKVAVDADGKKMGLYADLVADSSASNGAAMLDVHLRSSIAQNRMDGRLALTTLPDTAMLRGVLPFVIHSEKRGTDEFNMCLSTLQSEWILTGHHFGFSPAEVRQMGEKISVKNVGVTLEGNLLMDVAGVISDELGDTLSARFDHVDLEPILSAFARRYIPLRCSLNGVVRATALTGEKMRFMTKGLHLDSIVYDGIRIGDLMADMRWNNERKGVLARMTLSDRGKRLAQVQGVVKPAENMLKMVVSMDSLPLETFLPFASDYVGDVRGFLGANILAEGSISDPELDGFLFLKDSHMRVNYTGVGYSISDSIKFKKNQLRLDRFTVKDDNGNKLTIRGNISHERLQSFKYNLLVNMDNFLLLNNPKAKSNTVYGVFYANAKDLRLNWTDTHMKVTGEFSNGDKTSLNIVLPETVTEVQTYDNIVYVQPAGAEDADSTSAEKEPPLNIEADIMVGLTDQASFFVNVADGAMVNGNGNLHVTYNEGTVSIYNRYTVNNGYVKVKLSEIPAKKFTIQQGAYVEFNGDPMKLKFDATASYDLTADLATLSSTFSSMGLSTTRQPVRCGVHASGSLSQMNLTYDISLPKADNNVAQNLNSIITTDEIRIREFAYLIGLGMFYAPDEQAQGDMLTSLASSSLSSALNNALSSVLGDKVTIGTGFSSSQEDFSDMEMNVSVSTKLFNDRLLLSTNLGYQRQATADEESGSSFLGDFDAEYLLGKKKVVRLKAFNHTNNDFYRASGNTQGVGVVFVKEAKTFRGLLPFGKDAYGNNLLAPRDTVSKEERRDEDGE
ncbi:MAG: translocation/assembly module TamB domain-containing protein [Paludibacteraceae bacterium]|nr:translocation/assembly module TamB domain-containing protein [Paludibacteraceae bacterium]